MNDCFYCPTCHFPVNTKGVCTNPNRNRIASILSRPETLRKVRELDWNPEGE